jgi:hypothetical protein
MLVIIIGANRRLQKMGSQEVAEIEQVDLQGMEV